jgi:hypothetical protein
MKGLLETITVRDERGGHALISLLGIESCGCDARETDDLQA